MSCTEGASDDAVDPLKGMVGAGGVRTARCMLAGITPTFCWSWLRQSAIGCLPGAVAWDVVAAEVVFFSCSEAMVDPFLGSPA